MSVIRVLLVDDNTDFRNGVADWLVTDASVELVGTATAGVEAIELTERLLPDLVLLDESLQDMNGFEATQRLKTSGPAPLVVLMSFHPERTIDQAATDAGADGVVAKARITEALLPLIARLQAKQTVDRSIAERSMNNKEER